MSTTKMSYNNISLLQNTAMDGIKFISKDKLEGIILRVIKVDE